MKLRNIFINNFKELLQERKLTQEQIALALAVKQSSISKLLNGMTSPKFETLIKIADYFGVSLDYLVGRTENPEINK